jgi:hypothetical protein
MTDGIVGQTDQVFFDDIVISTGYIGPLVTGIAELNLNHTKKTEAYPNPFTNTTRIEYALTEQEEVKIDVYNALGNRITTIVDESQDIGEHFAVFNADNCSSGIYYYTIQTGDRTKNGKMILLR